jgi:hypothetical protein
MAALREARMQRKRSKEIDSEIVIGRAICKTPHQRNGEAGMMSQAHKRQLQRYVSDVWEKATPDAIDTYLSESYRRHNSPTSPASSREEQKELLHSFRNAFPDATLTVEEVIAEWDTLAFRSTFRGTHQGAFLGINPTGRRVEVGLVDMPKITDVSLPNNGAAQTYMT